MEPVRFQVRAQFTQALPLVPYESYNKNPPLPPTVLSDLSIVVLFKVSDVFPERAGQK